MKLLDRFKAFFNPPTPSSEPKPQAHWGRRSSSMPSHRYGTAKYGPINFGSYVEHNTEVIRERARGVYRESTIAHSIVTRSVDTVINTGLTWESSPTWAHIPNAPRDESARYEKTREIEQLWKAWADSTEPDVEGRLTFSQMQRLAYNTRMVDGEVTIIVRYLNAADRISPVALQFLNADQISTPYGPEQAEIEARGGRIEDGIEYDTTGREVAIWAQDNIGEKHKRIAYYGPRSGRRFVIRASNLDTPGLSRGFPELDGIVYELSRLTEYDIAELEGMVAASALLASIETEKDAPADASKIKVRPNVPQVTDSRTGDTNESAYGISTKEVGKFAIVMNNLEPGQEMKLLNNQRSAANFDAFVKSFVTRIAGSVGMPYSVVMQQFQSSYSAARAEILFYWLNVDRRRDDFIKSFLRPVYEAVFSEWVRSGEISASGFQRSRKVRRAWLAGSWNGVSRPTVDPLKEVNAVEKRTELGHTTGEKEAKAYNGSDFMENVNRLAIENEARAFANAPLNPQPEPQQPDDSREEPDDTGDNEEATDD